MLNSLTIIQVGMAHEAPLFRRLERELSKNKLSKVRWLIVDNDEGKLLRKYVGGNPRFIIGKSRAQFEIENGHWSHTLHHGESLDLAMKECQTKYALILDPDFIILDWKEVENLYNCLRSNDLDFLGTPWFPIYTEKGSNTIAPHFALVNLEKLREKQFSWINGISDKHFGAESVAFSNSQQEKFICLNRNRVLSLAKKTIKDITLLNEIWSYFSRLNSKGIDPDTGHQSSRSDFSKAFLLPIISGEQLAEFSKLYSNTVVRYLIQTLPQRLQLTPTKYFVTRSNSPIKFRNSYVECFLGHSHKLLGAHIRGYNFLTQGLNDVEIEREITSLMQQLSILEKEFGES